MSEVQLFGLGLQSKSPNVTANTLINAYYEFQEDRDRTSVAIYGTPGLTLFLDQGDTPWRGLHEFPSNSKFYGVHRGTCYEINNAGVATSIGTIGTTSGRVDICDDGDYIVFVDGAEIYTYRTSTTTFATVADADRPTSPNTCTFQGLRILTDEDGTGQYKGGDLNDPTSWDALNFATAESNPDNIVRIINYQGTIVLFGEYTTEFVDNVGGAGFPYARSIGSDLEFGLAARWSVAKFNGSYAFLGQNREGQVSVMALNGYGVQKISNTDIDHIINGYDNALDATAFGYSLGGHPMYQINFPSAGKSWLLDASTGYWSELRYKSNERHRAEMGISFLNQTIVADYSNGKLYKLEASALDDNGQDIHTILRGRHLYNDKQVVKFSRLELGYEPGTGLVSGQGVEPVAGLRVSKDGGNSWGTQTFAKMGAIGKYKNRLQWRRLGVGRDIVCEVTITDPVKRVFTEATLTLDTGR